MGQWGTEDNTAQGGRRLGRDPFGMGNIEDTARRFEVCFVGRKQANMKTAW